MQNTLPNSLVSAVIGLLLVLPFMMLEWVNREDVATEFPIVLFGLMWFLSGSFLLLLLPIVQTLRAGNSLMAKPTAFLLSVAFLLLIVWAWGTLVADQMPCFLGTPNCD